MQEVGDPPTAIDWTIMEVLLYIVVAWKFVIQGGAQVEKPLTAPSLYW